MYLAKGQCQKCSTQGVIAHSGYKHLCGRCNKHLWIQVSEAQKENWLKTGTVAERDKVQKNAK
jgi:ribosomal protein S27AE